MNRGLKRATLLASLVLLVGGAVAAAATASTDTRGGSAAASTVRGGVVYSPTGALAGFGAEFLQGFQYGLVYAKQTMRNCGGHKIDVSYVDDQTNPTAAVTAAKDLIGQGVKIIAGSTS